MRGENVLLQAPTGAGKTRAALAPFLQNLAESLDYLPVNARYAVPLRVLARQFFQEYEAAGQKIDRALNARLCATYATFGQKPVQIQTGEQPDDPQFEAALTFCTIDQLLASFLGIPYSLGKRSANLNVAAVAGAYLVLDEFHLYPLRDARGSFGARTTALEMLRMLNGNGKRLAPFVLMTATFSTHLLDELAALLGAVIVEVAATPGRAGEPSELEQLNAARERRFSVQREPMRAGTIVEQHDGCTLVVCNTVPRAQHMFLDLRQEVRQRRQPTEVMLIHSRFTDADRVAKQQHLEAAVGKGAWDGNAYHGPDIIIVATQVVEVGLDISVRTLHSEIAPANSIIQRAGRCARFARQHGRVVLYPLPEGEQHAPYDRTLSEATLAAFAQFDGRPVGFREEQQVIDAVHTDEDRALLANVHANQALLRSKIFRGIGQHDPAVAPDLIRYVQQAQLLVHPDPNGAIHERPWDWQLFALSPYSLQARWDALHAAAAAIRPFGDDRPIAWEARPDARDQRESDNDQGERVPTRYVWEPLTVKERIPGALVIALSPEVATYDPDLGFRLNDGRLLVPWPDAPFISERVGRRAGAKEYEPYEQETYAEHIGGLLNAYRDSRLRDGIRYVAARLEAALSLPPGSVDRAIRLAIACHDIAKLGDGWQRWAHAWQQALADAFPREAERYLPQKAPFAHTDYDWLLHRGLERGFKPARPYHACESAYLAVRIVHGVIADGRVARAITAAIARHHAALSAQYAPVQLIPEAGEQIAAMLQAASFGEDWQVDRAAIAGAIRSSGELTDRWMTLPRPENELETWLYFVIVRALRLADQRSFAF